MSHIRKSHLNADSVLSDLTKERQQSSEAESIGIEERTQVTEDDEEGKVSISDALKVSMTSKAWRRPFRQMRLGQHPNSRKCRMIGFYAVTNTFSTLSIPCLPQNCQGLRSSMFRSLLELGYDCLYF